MNKTKALIQTSQEAFDTARVLYQAGQAAPAVYYACHAFEQAGNAFATARGAATGQITFEERRTPEEFLDGRLFQGPS